MNTIDIDYASTARAALHTEKVRGANLLLWLIFTVIAGFFYWASQAQIDEVTKGMGKVIPSASVQTVQNLEGGIISEILVSEGGRVKKGDKLIKIDDTLSNASYEENVSQGQAYRAMLVRLLAEGEGSDTVTFSDDTVSARPELVQRETALFQKRKTELEEQLATIQSSLRLASDELTMTIPLVEKDIVSKVEQMRLEREVNELTGKLKAIEGAFQSDAMEQYNDTKAKLDSLEKMITGREDQVRRTVVVSPVDGTVNTIHTRTIGGVVQPGESLIDIVPDDDSLLVEAKIRPSDIAFVSPGQKAVMKFTAYDFSMYGGLEGVVEHISADTIEDEINRGEHHYLIKVRNRDGERLEKDGETLLVMPGMVVEIDVLTGRRTVLQYLLKPFHRVRFNALRER